MYTTVLHAHYRKSTLKRDCAQKFREINFLVTSLEENVDLTEKMLIFP